ncbi:hypothetical protein SBD_5458 [Streptomyces bottropensis ATCC 25435]|uniref:Uncharacterized protein n=1 Tax=Streptomyces bottropensis ATCC 25435 TaxID=1054862 RepID=M3EXI7_9ACTN|nr:hypothetical protein SBD_5458 [Streptomyces bottropensis ATCC 25435]
MMVSRRQARPERVWWGESSLDLTSWLKVRPGGPRRGNRTVSGCRWAAGDLRSEARGIAYSPCSSLASSPSTSTLPVSTAVSIQSGVARTRATFSRPRPSSWFLCLCDGAQDQTKAAFTSAEL